MVDEICRQMPGVRRENEKNDRKENRKRRKRMKIDGKEFEMNEMKGNGK